MGFNKAKLKKYLPFIIPAAVFSYIGNKVSFAWRISDGINFLEKLGPFIINLNAAFADLLPSLDLQDILFGFICAGCIELYLYYRKKNAKKFRHGAEYGSARWATAKDIEPYMDKENFDNNLILTQTERLTMGKPSSPKYARNKNVLVIGGSGAGKTRFYAKPNLMQMFGSYVTTDPKGTVLMQTGKMLQRGRIVHDKNGKPIYEPYKIKVFNTVKFKKSMHYNPFAYISEETREQDILQFVDVLIRNTSGSGEQKNEDFWVKSERLLYTAYIAMIFTLSPENERNFETLIDMINCSECREDDESFKNAIDLQFEAVEKWINNNIAEDDEMEYFEEMKEIDPTEHQIRLGKFACRQYKAFKLAAGKTAKSILVSCSARLACFSIDSILEITSYDEMELDKIGDELTALFIIISDTDPTFNFLVAIMYTQMFNLLCTKADNNPDGSGELKYPVHCILDEFANIGQIPNFEKLIATIRSRKISASIILQAQSQLKAIYKDNADTIIGNCDSTLFLGGKEQSTIKEISEILGKETIDDYDTSDTRGSNRSYGTNYKKLGKELMTRDELAVMVGGKCILQLRGVRPFFSDKFDITKHKQYRYLMDYKRKNKFDIEKYVSNRKKRRLTMRSGEKADVYKYVS